MTNEESTRSMLGQANPLLTVFIATYNRERYIRAALQSILQQAYKSVEIIVVDDGSTDGTPGIVAALIAETRVPIRYVHQPNRGQAAALNHSLPLAQGSIIAFLDSDDLWPEDRLPRQLAFFVPVAPFENAPGIVLGRKEYFVDNVTVNATELATANERPVHYCLGSSLVARWVFDKVGLFDESLGFTADWDWFVRAREARIPMVTDPRVTLLGRIHGGNMTENRALGAYLTARLIKQHLERKRGTPDA